MNIWQGYGLVALEQCKVTPGGHVLTTGPGTYKIPSVGNIPAEFNVTLLKGGIMDKAVYSSRVGLWLFSFFFYSTESVASCNYDYRQVCPKRPILIRISWNIFGGRKFKAVQTYIQGNLLDSHRPEIHRRNVCFVRLSKQRNPEKETEHRFRCLSRVYTSTSTRVLRPATNKFPKLPT